MLIRSIAVLAMALAAGSAAAQNAPELKGPKEKHGYAVGVELANQIKKMSLGLEDVDPEFLAKGFRDVIAGSKILLTDEEVRANIAELQAEVKKRRMLPPSSGPEGSLSAGEVRKAGEAFLAENKKMEGVVTLPSGLQYKILKAGDGKTPTLNDTVICHYRGSLIDGTEFDSSYGRNQPATFAVRGVIAGWTEALQLMPVGSKWRLFIPPSLAYGERGSGSQIGPGATLLFEIELLAIK